LCGDSQRQTMRKEKLRSIYHEKNNVCVFSQVAFTPVLSCWL
jgi:hypothetical protein